MTDDLISRKAAIRVVCEKDCYMLEPCASGCEVTWALEELPTAEPEYEGKGFLEFLWNVINPNEMESYLAMYNSKGVLTDG